MNRATFLFDPAVIGAYECEIAWFNFFNTFANVTAATNVFQLSTLSVYPPLVTITFEPGSWIAPTGSVTYADYAANPTFGINDVRYEIFRQIDAATATGLLTEAQVSPINGKLILIFDPASLGVAITNSTTATPWIGYLPGTAPFTSLTGEQRVNLGRPTNLVLGSPDFSNHNIHSGNDTKAVSWFEVVPVTVAFGEQQVYEPINPVQFKPHAEGIISRITIEIRDADTGLYMPMEESDQWSLMLRVKTDFVN